MPELPEVETSRRRVDKLFKGKRIIEVIPDPDDRIVYDKASPEEFRAAVESARVLGSGRKGKYFWLELDRKLWSESSRKDFDAKILPFCRLKLIADEVLYQARLSPHRLASKLSPGDIVRLRTTAWVSAVQV